jgi:hypothetical protein
LSLLMVGIIEWAIAREWTARARNELLLRVGGAAAVLLLAIFGGEMTATVVMMLVGVIGVIQVGVDLYWRSQRLTAHPAPEPPEGVEIASS